jgi:cytochrome d ubiquinol oxidase subunit I
MFLIALIAAVQLYRRRIESSPFVLRLLIFSIPIPTIAIQLGWMAAEAGRQPWIVYGVMKTSDGVSKVVVAPQIIFSIALFSVIYLLLGSVWLFLLRKEIMHGPEVEPLIDSPDGVGIVAESALA